MAEPSLPLASIVVEWENVRLAGRSRAHRMLQVLGRQVDEVLDAWRRAEPGSAWFELILVFDAAAVAEPDLEAMLREGLGTPRQGLVWRLTATTGGGYYEAKNVGALHATSDILIFLDSDVIPEPGWLQGMLAGLTDPQVQLVEGQAYLEPTGLTGKIFALTWFFPLRDDTEPARRIQTFLANNLAMRRTLQARYPFPDITGTSRGSCLVLAEQLKRAGVTMMRAPGARVAHPAPHGYQHLTLRALAQGRDRVLRERVAGHSWSASWTASFVRLGWHLGRCAGQIITGFRRVDLHPLAIPAALAIAWAYYLVYWVGETMTHARVPAIRRIRI